MRRALVLLFALAACGEGGPDPIATTPLAGTIGGRAFTARSARARRSTREGYKSVTIYDVAGRCSDPTPAVDRYVFATPVWRVDAAQDSYSIAFYVQGTGSEHDTITIADEARIEVVRAPADVGAKGLIRIRARANGDSVEGEIEVEVCE
jgi:hypothetical protein